MRSTPRRPCRSPSVTHQAAASAPTPVVIPQITAAVSCAPANQATAPAANPVTVTTSSPPSQGRARLAVFDSPWSTGTNSIVRHLQPPWPGPKVAPATH